MRHACSLRGTGEARVLSCAQKHADNAGAQGSGALPLLVHEGPHWGLCTGDVAAHAGLPAQVARHRCVPRGTSAQE